MLETVEFKTIDFKTVEKIAIIGPSGAGKTTLAKKLHDRRGLKVYHLDRFFWQLSLDRFFWQPRWLRASSGARIDILEKFAWEKSWIIEGTYINSSEVHLIKANTIIYLDISSFRCCWRVIKRHFEPQDHPRRDIPKGSSDRLTFLGILRVLFFPLIEKRKLEDKLCKLPSEKIIRLHSPKEVESFLAQLETCFNEMKDFSSTVVNENSLVLVRG